MKGKPKPELDIKPKNKKVALTDAERAERSLRVKARKEEAARVKAEREAREAFLIANILEDKPDGYNLSGERGLIAAIFVQALNDMLAYPCPNLKRKDIYTSTGEIKEKPEPRSICAMNFINAGNRVFRVYCDLLDMDPVRTEKAFYGFFRKELYERAIRKEENAKKLRENICSANTVTILTHLWSELLTMILAAQYFVEGNVRDAA